MDLTLYLHRSAGFVVTQRRDHQVTARRTGVFRHGFAQWRDGHDDGCPGGVGHELSHGFQTTGSVGIAGERQNIGFFRLHGTRVAVAIYHAQTGAWPPDNTAAGLLSPTAVTGRYVGDVRIDGGRIVITLGGQVHRKLRGGHVALTPYLDGALVRWHCASSDIEPDFLPNSCH